MALESLQERMQIGTDAAVRVSARMFDAAHATYIDGDEARLRHRIAETFAATDEAVVVAFALTNVEPACFAVVASVSTAIVLARHMSYGRATSLDARGQGAIEELGNILSSAFLSGMARHSHTSLLPSIPRYRVVPAAQALADFAPHAVTVGEIDVAGGVVWLLWGQPAATS